MFLLVPYDEVCIQEKKLMGIIKILGWNSQCVGLDRFGLHGCWIAQVSDCTGLRYCTGIGLLGCRIALVADCLGVGLHRCWIARMADCLGSGLDRGECKLSIS